MRLLCSGGTLGRGPLSQFFLLWNEGAGQDLLCGVKQARTDLPILWLTPYIPPSQAPTLEWVITFTTRVFNHVRLKCDTPLASFCQALCWASSRIRAFQLALSGRKRQQLSTIPTLSPPCLGEQNKSPGQILKPSAVSRKETEGESRTSSSEGWNLGACQILPQIAYS